MYAVGCGTETAVSERTRSGCQAASVHATLAPQSWPTTSARGTSIAVIRSAVTWARFGIE